MYWMLSLIYMGLIFCISSYPEPTKVPSPPYFDKAVHILEYGLLASLVYLALRDMKVPGRYLVGLAFAIAFLYGVSDEIHQYFVPGRHAEILDVLADGIGAFSFLLAFQYYDNRSNDGKTRPGNGRKKHRARPLK